MRVCVWYRALTEGPTHCSLYPEGLEAWQPPPTLPSGPRIWILGFRLSLRLLLSPHYYQGETANQRTWGLLSPRSHCGPAPPPPSLSPPSALPLSPCHLWNSALALFTACLSFPVQRFPPPFKSKPLSSYHHSQTPPSTCHPHPHTPGQEDLTDEPGSLQPGPGCLCNESGGNWWPPDLMLKVDPGA